MLEWCGEWAYSGRTQETPVGPATQFTGKMTGRPVLNGFAVEFLHEYYGGGPGGDRFAHEMGWYDPAAKRYSFLFVTDAGVIEKGATVPGDLTAAIAEYERAAAALRQALAQNGAILPPATRKVVEENLTIVETAVARLSSALAGDPGNRELALLLTAAYERQIDLLRTANGLART